MTVVALVANTEASVMMVTAVVPLVKGGQDNTAKDNSVASR